MGRKHRIAKKIVSRFLRDPAGALSYSLEQVIEAHRHTGTPIDPAKIESYKEAQEAYRAKARTAAQVNEARAEARRTRKAERIPTGLPEVDEALSGGAPTGAVADPHGEDAPVPAVEDIPEVEVDVKVEPVEAAERTLPPFAATDEELPDFEEMSVKDLKAECRARKLSGYSQLKKDELVALLAEHDG